MKFIPLIYCVLGGLLLSWYTHLSPPAMAPTPAPIALPDTFPSGMTEAEYARLLAPARAKIWPDSLIYFQLELVDWLSQSVITTAGGNYLIKTTFSSSDPSSLQFSGQGQFRLRAADVPNNLPQLLDSLIGGRAIIALPQHILISPTDAQETGMGQQDPYFPIYTSGRTTSLFYEDSLIFKAQIPLSVQLQDFEVIQ